MKNKQRPDYHILQLIADKSGLSSGRFLATIIVLISSYLFVKYPENAGIQNLVLAEAGMAFAAYTAAKWSKTAVMEQESSTKLEEDENKNSDPV